MTSEHVYPMDELRDAGWVEGADGFWRPGVDLHPEDFDDSPPLPTVRTMPAPEDGFEW